MRFIYLAKRTTNNNGKAGNGILYKTLKPDKGSELADSSPYTYTSIHIYI